MRLQVSIRRHALPIINIIFTTGTGPSSKTLAPNSTVTDLLQDVNDIVPLESADGEWGLEDYVVEVQATADQEAFYECLHYQPIESVLREDDEVIIRNLGTDDLRSRKLGGRHQISGDGRHLIDGVAFGRRWLRKGGRPAINIPPRKRRRLEIEGDGEELDEESTTLVEQIRELGYGDMDFDEDEDEDDDDFVDEGNDDETDEMSEKDDKDQPMLIKATAEFENADMDGDEGSEEESDQEDGELMAGAGLELSDELKSLLVEAEQLSENDFYHRLPSEATLSPRKGKRKRDFEEEDNDSEAEGDFEGFSIPANSSEDPPWPVSSVSSASISDDTTAPSDSDSNSDSEGDDAVGPTDTSSSGSSESGDSSSIDTSDSGSNKESLNSDSSSDSDSDEDLKLKETKLQSSSPAKQSSSQIPSSGSFSISTSSATSPNKRVAAAPGEGLKKTKKNNIRAQKRMRLARLKADGLLPADANFADMANMDEQTKAQDTMDKDIESKKVALLQQLQVDAETAGDTTSEVAGLVENNNYSFVNAVKHSQVDNAEDFAVERDTASSHFELDMNTEATAKDKTTTKEKVVAKDSMDVDESIPSQEISARAQDCFTGKTTPKSSEKRSKLDLASSRRMLFNSLGLRTPKTPEAEQALREKLAKDIKRTSQRRSEERANDDLQLESPADNDLDSWKDRIVLSAVECECEGVKLSAPPFPFKQGWDSNANMRRGASKKKSRTQAKYYEEGEEDESQYAPELSKLQDQSREILSEQDDCPESKTLSLEQQVADDMQRPRDFGILLNLDVADLAPSAVIAFKELDIDNFQPVVSEYRVARVREVQAGGSSAVVELMLSKKDWPTDRRGSDPFAIEDEDRLPEDGVRIKKFADLIEPKLIEAAASVQMSTYPADIAAKIVEDNTSAGLPQAQSSVFSESGDIAHNSIESAPPESKVLTMTHVEVNTPWHNEVTGIVKEAGFESAADKELLQPETQSSPAFRTRSHRSQRSSRSPALASIHASTTSTTRPQFKSPRLNGWESSSIGSVQMETTNTTKPETQSILHPAISQIEANVSGETVTNNSSFQDAQQVSQPPDIDLSALQPDLDTSKLRPEYSYDNLGDTTQQSEALTSEVPRNQSPLASSRPAAQEKPSKSSFLGSGLDGQASPDEESDFDSDNSSLPSLHELTSSQNHKINLVARRSRLPHSAKRSAQVSISPPAFRGKRLRNGKKRSASPDQSESDDDVELPPMGTKYSRSQQASMSQIPAGSQVVDLTSSSNPTGPESAEEYQAPRTRGAKAKRKTKTPATSSQRSESQSLEDASEVDSGSGIGKRRFLNTKKWSRA